MKVQTRFLGVPFEVGETKMQVLFSCDRTAYNSCHETVSGVYHTLRSILYNTITFVSRPYLLKFIYLPLKLIYHTSIPFHRSRREPLKWPNRMKRNNPPDLWAQHLNWLCIQCEKNTLLAQLFVKKKNRKKYQRNITNNIFCLVLSPKRNNNISIF